MSAAMPPHDGELALVPPTGKIGGGMLTRNAVATPVLPSPSYATSGRFLNRPDATPGVAACHELIGNIPLTPPPLPPHPYSNSLVWITLSSSVVPPTEISFGSDAGYRTSRKLVRPVVRESPHEPLSPDTANDAMSASATPCSAALCATKCSRMPASA